MGRRCLPTEFTTRTGSILCLPRGTGGSGGPFPKMRQLECLQVERDIMGNLFHPLMGQDMMGNSVLHLIGQATTLTWVAPQTKSPVSNYVGAHTLERAFVLWERLTIQRPSVLSIPSVDLPESHCLLATVVK